MIKIYNMDVMKALKQMPDESVDMQITSPPYWGLRDYGEGTETIWDGDENCKHEWDIIKGDGKRKSEEERLKNIERAKKYNYDVGGWGANEHASQHIDRAGINESNFCSKCGAWKGQLGLEPDFNLYIKHLADIFDEVKRVLKKDGTCWVNFGDTYGGSGNGQTSNWEADWTEKTLNKSTKKGARGVKVKPDVQPKCLCAIPERFMIEMINRGWILRNKIIWHKPNHMPTSVKDRFATSWEYLFFFSKSKKYYFYLDAVREAHKYGKGTKFNLGVRDVKRGYAEKSGQYRASEKEVEQYHGQSINYSPKGKNPDDVIQTRSAAYRHHGSGPGERSGFELSEAAQQLGKNPSDFWDITTKGYPEAHFAVFPEKLVERPIKTTRKNAVILDIFAGSGTTLKVARDLHRDSVGIEIKKDYCDLIKKRLFGGNQSLINDFEIIK